MITVRSLTFNPFAENCYVLSDETNECLIIDPGCFGRREQEELKDLIEKNNLKPVRLLNTHCHIDHVLGNDFVVRTWGLELEMNEKDLPVLESYERTCLMYGVAGADPQPAPAKFLDEGDTVTFGNSMLEIFFTPGHSPGSICFYSAADKFVIGGDVLFQGSIGRPDLPGGDLNTLLRSIKEKFLVLPGETVVYPGHGPETTIEEEKKYNPYLK